MTGQDAVSGSTGHRLVRSLTWPLIRRSVRKRLVGIEGLEHVPTAGAFVLTPNHLSYYDHFLLMAILRSVRDTPTWFLTKSEAFAGTVSGFWHLSWHCIPVARENPTASTMRAAKEVLNAGDTLCIYPEGTRGQSGEMLPFKDGPFRFGVIGEVPVIPVGLHGTDHVLPRGKIWPRRAPVRVVFGPALNDPHTGTRPARAAAMRDDAVGVIAALRARAGQPECGIGLRMSQRRAELIDAVITDQLDADGRLSTGALRRLQMLAYVGAPAVSADLTTQRNRLSGLRMLSAPKPAQLVLALALRRRLLQAVEQGPEHPMANYLLGRWYLRMPSLIGGGAERALEPLGRAVRSAADQDTRALAALAEAQLACGRVEAARDSLLALIRETDRTERGSARIIRAQQEIDRIAALPLSAHQGATP